MDAKSVSDASKVALKAACLSEGETVAFLVSMTTQLAGI